MQQREGRVKPDSEQHKGLNINSDKALEKEVDEQGKQAAQGKMADVKGKGSGMQRQENNTKYDDWTVPELKDQILAFLQTICEIKQEYLKTWFDNSKEEDTKWGAVIVESVISLTLGTLTAGVAGVISAHVTRNLAGLVQEGIKSAAGSVIQDLLKIGTAQVQKAAANGLASSSVSLEGKFKNAAWTQFNMEKDAHQTQTIHPDDSQFSSKDVLVAATQALEKTRDNLYKDGTAIMQQLTIGYLNFQDNSYMADKAGVTENDDESQRDEKIDNYKENNRDVVEYGARMGRLHFKGEVKGSPDNPTLLIDAGYYSKMNRSTANVLKGMNFSELGGVTMSFYLDAKDCDWNWLTGDIGRRAPITFEVGPQGIFVDQDRNGDVDIHVYKEGAEWLANYYWGETPSENNLLYFADKGAQKLFDNLVKTKAVPELKPSNLF